MTVSDMKSTLLVFLALAAVANAGTIIYTDHAGDGNQNPGFPGNLAYNFDVNTSITVTALGVFNADGTGTITGPIKVAIFNDTTDTEVTPEVTFSGTYTPAGEGYDVFQSIAPVILAPGHYQVVAVGFGVDPNGNLTFPNAGPRVTLNDAGGAITFTGSAFDFNATLDSPDTCDACVDATHQWNAGTFQIADNSAAPEPGSMALIGLGLAGAALLRRRTV